MSYGEQILLNYLGLIFTGHKIKKHYRPKWLRGLELDFYITDYKLAIEFQGDHHYRITDYSYNIGGKRYNDKRKKKLCKENNVRLITLDPVDLNFNRICSLCLISKIEKQKLLLKINYQDEINRLNKKSKIYLATLKKHYPVSINVHQKGTRKRKRMIKKNKKRDKLIQSIKSSKKLEHRMLFS